MISKNEINDFSANLGLSLDVIEKDYVLGWVLAGIHYDTELRDNWVFKGGTCLKKCFFEAYRFSEDLDFTLKKESQLSSDFLEARFAAISEWVYENSGIELPVAEMDFKERENARGNAAVKGKITYHGPIRRLGSLPRIKLDLTADEALITKPVKSTVNHSYSDFQDGLFYINSYSYAEAFAEKLRASVERCLPRDLYDIVEIYRRKDLRPSSSEVLKILTKKCEFKGVELPTKELMKDMDRITELRNAWDNMLKHQLKDLPLLDQFLDEFDEVIDWLVSTRQK